MQIHRQIQRSFQTVGFSL